MNIVLSFSWHQALGYISGSSRTELPHVVERETVKEDGTVVRRCVSAADVMQADWFY